MMKRIGLPEPLTQDTQFRWAKPHHGPVVVAIPVKNEEERITTCIDALNTQIGYRPDHVVLLLNNCSDSTFNITQRLMCHTQFVMHVEVVDLPPDRANAGFARHLALEKAWSLAGDTGILLTTDADGRVDADWVGANLSIIQLGADAVAGWVELDPLDWGAIPLQLHEDDARERAYDAVCDELVALLDPDPADPLPRHTQASGASLAVTGRAYRAAGGIPLVAHGEDRAFVEALRRIDARIRHAPECRVVVSGRIEGRATGGMADTIRRRLITPDIYLDERLEPADICALRASLRWLARRAHDSERNLAGLHFLLGLEEDVVRTALDQPRFGMAWAELEAASPKLVKRQVMIADLANQQRRVETLRQDAWCDVAGCRKALWRRSLVGSQSVATPLQSQC